MARLIKSEHESQTARGLSGGVDNYRFALGINDHGCAIVLNNRLDLTTKSGDNALELFHVHLPSLPARSSKRNGPSVLAFAGGNA